MELELELEKEFTCCSLLLHWRETVLKVFFFDVLSTGVH